MREALIKEKVYSDEELPCEATIGNILNRLGYNLKRVLKAKSAKKIKEVDEIFENVWKANEESDKNPQSLRISVVTSISCLWKLLPEMSIDVIFISLLNNELYFYSIMHSQS